MWLICAIDVLVVFTLVRLATKHGLERALPAFVFFLTLIPGECRIVTGVFDLYTSRLALIVLAALFFTKRKKSVIQTFPLKNLLFVHAGWLLLSTLVSIVVLTSAKQFLAQVLEYYLIYYIILKTVTDVQTISKLAFAMVAAVGVACCFGLLEIYAGWSVLSIFPAELQQTFGSGNTLYTELMDRGIRARSTFPHPILFGAAISMVLPLAMYLLTTVSSRFQKVFLYVCVVVMFWNLYKTSSRGPWLATIASLAVLLLGANRKVRKQLLVVGVLASLVLLVRPGVTDTIWNTYLATLNPNTGMGMSFAYRPALYRAVTKALEDPQRALLGFGLGAFRDEGLIIVLPNIAPHRWFTCDSAWLLLTYETGYVGLLFIGALLMKPAVIALRAYRTLPKPERYFCINCVSCLVSFFVVMISVAAYGWGQNGQMLWVVIAMTVSYVALSKRGRERQVPVALPAMEEMAAF
jgi:hypothetical protein